MRLIFNLLVVVIFRILIGKVGSNWRLSIKFILIFRTFDLIGRFVRRSGSYGQCSMQPMFDAIDVRCNRCSM